MYVSTHQPRNSISVLANPFCVKSHQPPPQNVSERNHNKFNHLPPHAQHTSPKTSIRSGTYFRTHPQPTNTQQETHTESTNYTQRTSNHRSHTLPGFPTFDIRPHTFGARAQAWPIPSHSERRIYFTKNRKYLNKRFTSRHDFPIMYSSVGDRRLPK